MFVTRMSPETELRIYNRRTGEYVGMVKVLRPKCEEGKAQLGLEFDKGTYEFVYKQREPVVTVVDSMPFGDHNPDEEWSVPDEACNGLDLY